ncbi:MAG: IS1595 family transposase [Thermodesulfobacteriota bacterium]
MITYTTINQFNKEFPDDDACLEHIFNQRYGKNYECPRCHKTGFYRNRTRKCYSCAWCGYDLSPLAGTIFHKSSTNLKNWFFAIFLMSTSKNGVAAKEIQRQTGVTYKTAWRMQRQIRMLMRPDDSKLNGTIEIDDTYIGGKRPGKRGRGASGKTPVLGIVEREGDVKADVVENMKKKTVMPIIEENVEEKSTVYTDEFSSYGGMTKAGFEHDVVQHGIKEYVRGEVHTNTIEGFWSQLKRSLHGTYHSVSPKHLQLYVDEFAWRYNHRAFSASIFHLLLQRVVVMPS